jgi:hypothetical protein
MEEISFDAMRFGSENDLKIALTELKWTEKSNGHISENDFLLVSQKYLFPIDFLKKGLEGFSYPQDSLISKSRWFTILFSWTVRDRDCSLDLFRLQFAYVRARSIATYAVGFSIVALFYVDYILPFFVHIDSLQRLYGEILPFVFFIVSLGIGLIPYLNDKKTKADEYSQQLRETGLGYIVESNEKFINRNYLKVVVAGNILLRKFEEPNTVIGFPIGTKEMDTEPSRRTKLLCRLHLLPKSYADSKKEMVPVFYAENAYVEYQKRIEELSKQNQRKYVQKS